MRIVDARIYIHMHQMLHGLYAPLRLKYLPGIHFTDTMSPPLPLVHVMSIQMGARFETLLPSTIEAVSRVLSILSVSLDMQPVTILQTFFNEHPELCALRREILSQLAKDRLALIGEDLMGTTDGSSSVRGAVSREELEKYISLGMDVMLAGGPPAVIGLIVDQIRDKTLEVRRKTAAKSKATRSRRAFEMGLCLEGASVASLLYSLGGAAKHWEGFFDLDVDVKAKLVEQILAKAASERARGGRAGGPASVEEEARREVHMRLCTEGMVGAHILYSLGGGGSHWTGWDDLVPGQRAKLVKQILADAALN
jgi:hypothetical protein